MPSMAPVNTTCPIEIMYTCLMRQYMDFLKGVYTHANTTYNAHITKHIIRSLIFSQEAYANLLIMFFFRP
jgi:hypothetical protein